MIMCLCLTAAVYYSPLVTGVCVCVLGVDLMDKVSIAIRQKHHNQPVGSLHLSVTPLIYRGMGLQFGPVLGH